MASVQDRFGMISKFLQHSNASSPFWDLLWNPWQMGGGPEIGGVPQISKKHHKTYKQRYKKQKQLPGPGGPQALVVLSCCLYILGGGVKSWRWGVTLWCDYRRCTRTCQSLHKTFCQRDNILTLPHLLRLPKSKKEHKGCGLTKGTQGMNICQAHMQHNQNSSVHEYNC